MQCILPATRGGPERGEGEGCVRKQGEYRIHVKARRLRQSMTKAEVILWTHIRRRSLDGARFRRQHVIAPYIADFACCRAKLVVEVDGATHSTPEELAYDARRTKYLESQGWTVVRVSNTDIYENMDGVWRTIAVQLPPPPRSARDLPAGGED